MSEEAKDLTVTIHLKSGKSFGMTARDTTIQEQIDTFKETFTNSTGHILLSGPKTAYLLPIGSVAALEIRDETE